MPLCIRTLYSHIYIYINLYIKKKKRHGFLPVGLLVYVLSKMFDYFFFVVAETSSLSNEISLGLLL